MAITAAELMVKIGADTADAERGMQSVSERLSGFGKGAAVTGGLLTAGLTLPLVGVAQQALSTAMDFESSLNMMQAVSGATDEQMQQVAETAKALGADMSLPATSAANAATAMVELAKAGLSVNDTLDAAKGVLQLAAAGNLSEAQAAEIAANALNAFGLQGSEATRVADLLAAAANASSGDVTDMADSLKMASAVAASAGIPIEEVVAAISQMANAGIKGSDAGTSLKQMLLSLMAPSKKAEKAMQELGISVYDSEGKMLPMPQIIEQFSTKLGRLSQEQRNAALATIFGSDAVRAANIVLMGGVDAHQEMLEAVTEEGAAAELSGARMKGLSGALQGLQSQVETVLLEAAEPFLGTLENLARTVADLIPKIMEIDPNIRNAALAFAAVLAAAGPLTLVVGGLATALGFLLSPLGLVTIAAAGLAAAWTANFMGIQEKVGPVIETIQRFLSSLLELFGALISGSADLGDVVDFIGEWTDGAIDASGALETLRGVWETVKNTVTLVVGEVSEFITRELGIVVEWTNTNLPLIRNTFQAVMDAIRKVVEFVLGKVRSFWEDHGEKVLTILRNDWELIKTTIDTALQLILNVIRLVMQIITGDWSGAWETVKRIVQLAWDLIMTIVRVATDNLKQLLSMAWESIRSVAESAWNGIKSTISGIWDEIIGAVDEKIGSLKTALSTAWDSIKSKVDEKWGEIKDAIVGVWDRILEKIRDAIDEIKRLIGGLPGGIGNLFGGSSVGVQSSSMIAPGPSLAFSAAAGGASVGAATVNVYATVSNDLDIEMLARRIAEVIQRKQR